MNIITVVGAGPIGLNTAIKLKEDGWDVQVIEEHSSIGKPVNCSGLVSVSGLKALNVDATEATINYIYGARIYSPSGKLIEVKKDKPVAVVLDRERFDNLFYDKAISSGVPVSLNTKLLNVKGNTVFIQKDSHGEMLKSKILVGADGVQSKMREMMNIQIPANSFVHAYQEKIEANFDKTFVEIFLSERFKGFFAWLIPSNENYGELGLGVTVGYDIKKAIEDFKELLRAKGFEFETLEKKSFLIPCARMPDNLVKDNLLLVGDAAFQTKATTGGGIITGLMSSNVLARSISNFIKNKKPLTAYNNDLKDIRKELLMHWKIRSYFNSLSDREIDSLFETLKKSRIEEFLEEYGDMDKPSKFIPRILSKPSMWRLIPLAMRFI